MASAGGALSSAVRRLKRRGLAISGFMISKVLVACNRGHVDAPVAVNDSPNCIRSQQTGGTSCNVSLLRLLATPKDFDGARVQTTGYVHFEFEGDSIYFRKDDLYDSRFDSAIWLTLSTGVSPDKCQDSIAFVEGTFHAGFRGHLGIFAGELADVTRCEPTNSTE